jgi:hypothetical protein
MRSPTILTGQVRRTRLPVVRRRCLSCGSDTSESSGKFRVNDVPCRQYPCSVRVTFANPVPLRPVHLIARGLGVSRSKIKQMVDVRLIVLPSKLGFETCATFEFTIMAETQDKSEDPGTEVSPSSGPGFAGQGVGVE